MTEIVEKEHCFPELVEWFDELAAFRHDLHAHPELGFDTERTCGKIVEALKRFGIEKIDSTSVKGAVFALIEGNRPGKTIAIRGDIDALPMDDGSANPWKSTTAVRCHACGHDGHATWVLGAARYLAAHRDFPGRVLAIFQPAEEIGRGAKAVCDAGILEKYDVAEIYGMHDEATLPKGVAGCCKGPAQASCDFFYVTIKGVGTHGARPHLGVDPIPAGCELVGTLQTIVSRKVNPIEKAVLSVCSVNAGRFGTANVIPAEFSLCGTVRTFNQEVREQIEAEIRKMSAAVAEASGCTAEVRYDRLTPAVINSEDAIDHMAGFILRQFGEGHVDMNFPITMGGEDFAEYQFKVPGAIIRFGIRDEAHTVSIHNPIFDFNDEVIPMGSTILAGVALERLNALADPA